MAADQGKVEVGAEDTDFSFHHVQLYVDSLKPLAEYKKLEDCFNNLANKGSYDPFSGGMKFLGPDALPERVQQGAAEWKKICEKVDISTPNPADFAPAGQDVVEQLIVGLGWRVTAQFSSANSQSYLVTSADARGVKVVVTCKQEGASKVESPYNHFSADRVEKFMASRAGRQGMAVLGFEVSTGALNSMLERYKTLHPKLLIEDKLRCYYDTRKVEGEGGKRREIELGSMKILDVYAYYKGEPGTEADEGTMLRFVERAGSFASREGFSNPHGVLPGLEDVPAKFDGTSIPAYSDHWVSNVYSRQGFLKTLEDVAGFTPKVDFNAGVVAAGEAQIESTVTGNASKTLSLSEKDALSNQTQVYLPINNALSPVGHVHGFLKEMGQGVQHLASRVSDLVSFIERVNNYRMITGRGLSFLNIPRSYYGRLDVKDLIKAEVPETVATQLLSIMEKTQLMTPAGVVDLDITDAKIEALGEQCAEAVAHMEVIKKVVKKARYSNLYSLLRDHLCENTYLKIVRNKILVDIQGDDILYQIFTCNVLQREAGQESPFFEFIQRVCSECKDGDVCKPIKPGCGGFGIRNFLTLFLSIEVSKSMNDYEAAKEAGDEKKMSVSKKMVDAFTEQLELSNPVLTKISDAMTAEGNYLELVQKCTDEKEKADLEKKAKEQCELKLAGNNELKVLSEKYKKIMQEINA